MTDIQNRNDIEKLVRSFYSKALIDEEIGFFFTEVATFNLEEHIPVFTDFWSSILLGDRSYSGNPMIKHMDMAKKHPIEPAHFDRWLSIWRKNVAENFEGPVADEAANRAGQIAELMRVKG
jgi:hemoglobin